VRGKIACTGHGLKRKEEIGESGSRGIGVRVRFSRLEANFSGSISNRIPGEEDELAERA
jgi:hypothetical protein